MIARNLQEMRNRIAAAAQRVGRSPSEITLVAVSKGQPIERIQEAWEAGQRDFGENYAQEMLEHIKAIEGRIPSIHFIGHLQRNKVKQILPQVSLIHSVDSPELAQEVDKRAAALGKVQPILIEVNVGEEASKTGLAPDRLETLVSDLRLLTHVDLRGLMTIPPASEDLEETRRFFRLLREIRDALNRKNIYKQPLAELSMGMTQDFEAAIEEGSTIVRIGTGIFGERQKA